MNRQREIASNLVLALASIFSSAVAATPTTVTYRGTVTYVQGAEASRFHVGDPILVKYVVEPAAEDSNPLPTEGVFFGGLVSLEFSLPLSGLSVATAAGTVQTFNNVVDSDQAFFYSYSVLSPTNWAGGQLLSAEVDFVSGHTGEDGLPDMLANDSIPLTTLDAPQAFVSFYTAAGRTAINFSAVAEPTVAELVQDGLMQIDDLIAGSRLKVGVGNALKAKLNALLLASSIGDTTIACRALADFRNQVNALSRTHRLTADGASELNALSAALSAALGGC